MGDTNTPEQLNFFGEDIEKYPCECCYRCKHFAEFKEPRTYVNRDYEFELFGMCCKSFSKNGSYSLFAVYIPKVKCKDFKKIRKGGERE